MTVRDLEMEQLGALPVVRAYLERLGVQQQVDGLAPVRAAAHLTNGEVVVALVANPLTAPRPLYDLIEREARRALAEGEKDPARVAGPVAARPTGEHIFQALREIPRVRLKSPGHGTPRCRLWRR